MEFLLVSLSILMLVLFYYTLDLYRQITKLKTRIQDSLGYICILIENVYTYKNDPKHLRDHLLHEMTVKKLLCYHLIEEDETIFPPDLKCSKKDKLLYKLHLEGFTPKELCILFELNNLNSVYVKCHRINKKLNPTVQDRIDAQRMQDTARKTVSEG